MKKYKLGLIGAGGRMGKEISTLVSEQEKFEAWFGITKNKKDNGFKFNHQNLNHEAAASTDLWIDFSSPDAFLNFLPTLIKMKKPVVTGTTGFTEAQLKKITKAGENSQERGR